METSIFYIPGMDCPVEEKLIRDKLAKLKGIDNLEFNLLQRKLTILYQHGLLPQITESLNSLDMGAVLEDGNKVDIPQENPIPWRKLIIAGIFALSSEIFDLFQEWQIDPFGTAAIHWQVGSFPFFSCISFLLAVVAIILAGLETYKKGWIAISNFNLNINALMAVAVTAAVLIGQYPEAAAVIVLFDLSEAIEAKSLDKARNAIKDLMALAPEMATIKINENQWQEVPASDVKLGQIVRVRPGERIALDGEVISGSSTINQASITGESMPVQKSIGDHVFSGTINQMGSFEYRVTAISANTTLAKIINAVENAQSTRAPIQRFIDVFAKYYTPVVFCLAILVAFIPPLVWGAEWYPSIYRGLVILIIGCPCALVISTPVSVVSGMAAATASGILVKGGIFMEYGRLLRWLALDKTGTITLGKPRLADFEVLNNLSEEQALTLAASLAARSDHPVSRAIADAASEKKLNLLDLENFKAYAGEGISGDINGQTWNLGNLRLLTRLHKDVAEDKIKALENEGKSVVGLSDSDQVAAIMAVADVIRPESVDAIKQLKQLGVNVIMLTGDNEPTAAAIAKEVGIDEFKANLLPQDKLKFIESLETRQGKTGMVGDGINDAPALAKADISFAMAGMGTDTAIETADVALMDDDLRKIPRFIKLSSATFKILVENITLALLIKIVFFILALTGYATMWMAVFADVGAALIVVGNGLRAMKK